MATSKTLLCSSAPDSRLSRQGYAWALSKDQCRTAGTRSNHHAAVAVCSIMLGTRSSWGTQSSSLNLLCCKLQSAVPEQSALVGS